MELVETKYKQTDIGLIPSDWEVKRFADITKVITCGLAATPKYVEEAVGKPFLSAQNIQDGKVVYDKYKFISKELFEQITKHNPPQKGDLLYTRVGAGIGEAGVIEDDFKFGIYVSLTLIKTDKRQLYNYYLLHLLNSPKYKFLAKNGQFAGGGVQNLNVQIVREFLIPLPSIAEQTAIATALSDADNYISSLEKLIAKKRLLKQGAMQQLLSPKEGWVVKKLGEVAEFYKGKGLPKSAIVPDGKYKCIHYGELFTRYNEVVNDVLSYTNQNQNSFYSVRNDVLMPTSDVTPNGLATATCIKESNVILGGDVLVIRAPENILDGIYLSYCIGKNRDQIMQLVSGSTVFHLYGSDMKKFEFYLPPIQEQTRIATILSDMDAGIAALEKQLAKARSIKQGMMQQLLTGRIRLNH